MMVWGLGNRENLSVVQKWCEKCLKLKKNCMIFLAYMGFVVRLTTICMSDKLRIFYNRLKDHRDKLRANKHGNAKLQSDYNEYGEMNFEFVVLEQCPIDSLDDAERKHISNCRENGACYNVFSGGRKDYTADDEFRRKMSMKSKGKIISEHTKSLMSENARKQWENPEYAGLMSDSAKQQWQDKQYREKMTSCYKGWYERKQTILTAEKVIEARNRYKNGERVVDMLPDYGVAESTLRSAINGTTWKNI